MTRTLSQYLFECGRLVKVQGRRVEYMDGATLIIELRKAAEALSELAASADRDADTSAARIKLLEDALASQTKANQSLREDLDALAMNLGQAEQDKAALAARIEQRQGGAICICPETWEGSDAFREDKT